MHKTKEYETAEIHSRVQEIRGSEKNNFMQPSQNIVIRFHRICFLDNFCEINREKMANQTDPGSLPDIFDNVLGPKLYQIRIIVQFCGF